ncbi:MAG: hypothetical protein QW783_02065, partial [Candidatus Micrarchaeia archaeon]
MDAPPATARLTIVALAEPNCSGIGTSRIVLKEATLKTEKTFCIVFILSDPLPTSDMPPSIEHIIVNTGAQAGAAIPHIEEREIAPVTQLGSSEVSALVKIAYWAIANCESRS